MRGPGLFIGCATIAALTATAHAQDCDGWVPIGDPGWRQQAGTVFDPVRGVTVLFGGGRQVGSTGEHIYADTWTHDGRRWNYIPTAAAPTGKLNPLMSFDPASGRVLLHGGRAVNFGTIDTTTWAFDGENWSVFASGGPATVAGGGVFAYDPTAGAHWCTQATAGAMRLWRLAAGVWTEVLPAEGQSWPGATSRTRRVRLRS
ncbi:MAG: hypothetical protein QM783_03490 [Phycisphaerales bacterium]